MSWFIDSLNKLTKICATWSDKMLIKQKVGGLEQKAHKDKDDMIKPEMRLEWKNAVNVCNWHSTTEGAPGLASEKLALSSSSAIYFFCVLAQVIESPICLVFPTYSSIRWKRY